MSRHVLDWTYFEGNDQLYNMFWSELWREKFIICLTKCKIWHNNLWVGNNIFSFSSSPLWSETDLIHVRMNLNIPAELCWKYSGGKHKLETENKHHAPLFPGPSLNTSQQPINLIKSRKMFQRNYIFTRSSSALRMPALHSSKSWYKCSSFFFDNQFALLLTTD